MVRRGGPEAKRVDECGRPVTGDLSGPLKYELGSSVQKALLGIRTKKADRKFFVPIPCR